MKEQLMLRWQQGLANAAATQRTDGQAMVRAAA